MYRNRSSENPKSKPFDDDTLFESIGSCFLMFSYLTISFSFKMNDERQRWIPFLVFCDSCCVRSPANN